MIRNASLHRGSLLDGAMHAAEVVIGEVKCQRCLQVVPLLAERIRQARKPLAPESQRSVLAFDVRRADFVHFWVSIHIRFMCLSDVRWAVSTLLLCGGCFVDLHELSIVHAVV